MAASGHTRAAHLPSAIAEAIARQTAILIAPTAPNGRIGSAVDEIMAAGMCYALSIVLCADPSDADSAIRSRGMGEAIALIERSKRYPDFPGAPAST